MALIPKDRYPGQTVSSDPSYPHGKARNVTVEGDGTGTPFEADLVNDVWGFLQSLLVEAGIAPTNVVERVGLSQYLEALQHLIANIDQDVSINGDVSCHALNAISVNASGVVNCNGVESTGNVSCMNVTANNVTVNGKLNGSSGVTTVGGNLLVEGSLRVNTAIIGKPHFSEGYSNPTSAGVDGPMTVQTGVCYIAAPTGAHVWTLPPGAADGSWVEVTADHGSSGRIILSGFPGGLAIDISADATGPMGNGRWRFCIARKIDGAWKFGPRGF